MGSSEVVVQGIVKPDGTLEVHQKLALPAGRVEVMVKTLAEVGGEGPSLMDVLHRIWSERRSRGAQPRTREEIDAEISAGRDESEEELRELEQTQASARRGEERGPC